MLIVLKETDPLGRECFLTKRRWNDKILRAHSKLKLEWVRSCVLDPEWTAFDADYADRRVLYRCRFTSAHDGRRRYQKVVIELQRRNPLKAEIVSAFQCDDPKQGEKIEWLKGQGRKPLT